MLASAACTIEFLELLASFDTENPILARKCSPSVETAKKRLPISTPLSWFIRLTGTIDKTMDHYEIDYLIILN